MLLKLVAFTGFSLVVFAAPAAAMSDSQLCQTVVEGAANDTIKRLTDGELRLGLCRTSKAILTAIETRSPANERLCSSAAHALGREFVRRFPKEDMRLLAGRC